MVYTLLSEIQKEYLKSPELSSFVLSENVGDGAEQFSASAYMLCLYESYRLYILDWGLETWRVENHWKVARYVVTNTKREALVVVNFQDSYYSVSYQIIY